jgi:hypothetical protein
MCSVSSPCCRVGRRKRTLPPPLRTALAPMPGPSHLARWCANSHDASASRKLNRRGGAERISTSLRWHWRVASIEPAEGAAKPAKPAITTRIPAACIGASPTSLADTSLVVVLRCSADRVDLHQSVAGYAASNSLGAEAISFQSNRFADCAWRRLPDEPSASRRTPGPA